MLVKGAPGVLLPLKGVQGELWGVFRDLCEANLTVIYREGTVHCTAQTLVSSVLTNLVRVGIGMRLSLILTQIAVVANKSNEITFSYQKKTLFQVGLKATTTTAATTKKTTKQQT